MRGREESQEAESSKRTSKETGEQKAQNGKTKGLKIRDGGSVKKRERQREAVSCPSVTKASVNTH